MRRYAKTDATHAQVVGAHPRRARVALRLRTLVVLAVATAIGSMGLAAGGTAGALLGVRLTGTEATRGRALGAVFFATAFGAVASPALLGPSGVLARMLGLPPLAGLYVVAITCYTLAALLLTCISSPTVPFLGRGAGLLGPSRKARPTRTEYASALSAPPARIAVSVLAATNVVMVAVMAVAPVHMVAYGHGLGLVGLIVGVHVAGMFAPSPISGWVVDKVGPASVIAAGFTLLIASSIVGVSSDSGSTYWMIAKLTMLGIGWNFGVVGGSILLAVSVPSTPRPHVEGLGEVAMGLAAGIGAPMVGLIVALGGFSTLYVAGVVVAILALVLALRVA